VDCFVMAVTLDNRIEEAPKFQEVLTKHGCIIKMRLGLHEAGDKCSNQGLIIMQLVGTEEDVKAFENDLKALNSLKVKWMKLDC